MVLVFQILLAVVVLAGLITVIMSAKTWHWAQMLLLLAIFFSSIGALLLGLEVYRIHRTFRARMPQLERQLAEVELQIEALRYGTGDRALAGRIFGGELPFDIDVEQRMPGQGVWSRRLQDQARQRGRVWRNAARAGNVDPATGRVAVTLDQPQPHGLTADSVVYVFEEGNVNPANPAQGAQFLGEFRVIEVRPNGATLESVVQLDNRTGPRVAGSQRPWTLYETMPADRHELFAGMTEEELRQLIPAASIDEYLRHGQEVERPAAADAFDPAIAMVDEAGVRVGPDDAAKAVKWLYDRQLRDYPSFFATAHLHLVQQAAQRSALQEDIAKLAAAQELAKQFGAQRTEERQALTGDLGHLERDRDAIQSLLATVQQQLENARRLLAEAIQQNMQLAAELAAQQGPAPAVVGMRGGAAVPAAR